MPNRRPSALAAPVLGMVLAASLSACGFHYPTDRVNTISAGVNYRNGTVDALGVRILATAPGHGRLIGALANRRATPAQLTKVGSADGAVTATGFKPVKVDPMGHVNLATDIADPILVSGKFEPGEVVMDVQLTFERQGAGPETAELNVPVVKPCNEYTAVPTPSESSSAPAPAKGKKAQAAASATTSSTSSSTATASASSAASAPTGEDNPFSCTDPSPTGTPAE